MRWTPARAGKPRPTERRPRARRVDPRSRGEAASMASHTLRRSGGPPLARGSPPDAEPRPRVHGWTPARAGKPWGAGPSFPGYRVDPRSRGEAMRTRLSEDAGLGGPPLARGSRWGQALHSLRRGWTPARAGKPDPRRGRRAGSRVDPRSRGEAWTGRTPRPRPWGGPPLARGSHLADRLGDLAQGWTPARAGKPAPVHLGQLLAGVDPRSRGEAMQQAEGLVDHEGGPPLARGSLRGPQQRAVHPGWTPARAGKPP